MQKSIKYIGLILFVFAFCDIRAQTAMNLDMYVSRVNLDTIGHICTYQRVLIAVDKYRLGVRTDQDTLVLLKKSILPSGHVLGWDEFHNNDVYISQVFTNDDGLLIFITQIEGKNRFGLVLSTKSCEN